MNHSIVRKVLRDRAHIGTEQVEPPILTKRNIQDADLKDVTDACPTHEDRAGQDVIARPSFDFLMNLLKVRQYLEAGRLRGHPFRIARDTFDGDTVAGIAHPDRFQSAIEIAPMNGVRRGL